MFWTTLRTTYKCIKKIIHAVYDVFSSNNMKSVLKVLEEVISARPHAHMFCSTAQFFLFYKNCCRKSKGKRSGTKVDSDDTVSKLKRSKSVELQLSFEINNSAIYHIRAGGNFQQTTAAKCAAHPAVIEIAFHFWPSRVSWQNLLSHANHQEH